MMDRIMLGALSKSVSQIGDPAFRGVLKRAVGLALSVLVLVWAGAWFALDLAGARLDDWLAGQGTATSWATALSWLSGSWLFDAALLGAILLAGFLLFPAIVTLAMSFFLEEIAEAVERRHYPDLPAARAQPVGDIVRDGISLAAIAVFLNLLVLPLYLIPVINIPVFYGLNGYLLGREYFELVAVRRLKSSDARRLRRRYRGRVFLAGAIVAVLFTIPLVNLLTPILATAFLVHVFESLRRGAPGSSMA